MKWLWLLTGFVGCSGVALGAIGAHAMAAALPTDQAGFETAVRYHLLHNITAGLALALVPRAGRLAGFTACLFLASILLFSGSIYLQTLTTVRMPLAPIGGAGFMAGWLLLGLSGWRACRQASSGEIKS